MPYNVSKMNSQAGPFIEGDAKVAYVAIDVDTESYTPGGIDMSGLFQDIFGISNVDQIDSVQIVSGSSPANPIHGKWIRDGQKLWLHRNNAAATQAGSELTAQSINNWAFYFKIYQRAKS